MRLPENIERFVKNRKPYVAAGADIDKRVLGDSFAAMEDAMRTKSAVNQPNIWRIIMKTRTRKLTSVAAAVLIVALGIFISDKLTTPVWAIDQTIEALNKVNTIIVSGTTSCDNNSISYPFKFWIKLDDMNGNLFMRVETEREFVIVRGDTAYFRKPGTNKVRIVEGATIQNLQFWYQFMELSPWFTGKMLKKLNSIASDWKETYGKNDKTGRDSVFVECSYKQLKASFEFIFDVESKLIVEAKHWMNTNRQGPPNLYITSFVYNEEISDEMFEFEIPDGAEVICRKYVEKRNELMQKAWELFEDKQYAKALKIYQEADDLFMIGICYGNMGEHEKGIESFKEIINQEEDFQGNLSATYFYLGNGYMDIGQREKAIEALENCLKSGQGFLNPEVFPMKNAREYIEKLKNQK